MTPDAAECCQWEDKYFPVTVTVFIAECCQLEDKGFPVAVFIGECCQLEDRGSLIQYL